MPDILVNSGALGVSGGTLRLAGIPVTNAALGLTTYAPTGTVNHIFATGAGSLTATNQTPSTWLSTVAYMDAVTTRVVADFIARSGAIARLEATMPLTQAALTPLSQNTALLSGALFIPTPSLDARAGSRATLSATISAVTGSFEVKKPDDWSVQLTLASASFSATVSTVARLAATIYQPSAAFVPTTAPSSSITLTIPRLPVTEFNAAAGSAGYLKCVSGSPQTDFVAACGYVGRMYAITDVVYGTFDAYSTVASANTLAASFKRGGVVAQFAGGSR